jgi:hypothetical protein
MQRCWREEKVEKERFGDEEIQQDAGGVAVSLSTSTYVREGH